MNWYGLVTMYVLFTGFLSFADLFDDSPIQRFMGFVKLASATVLMSYVELWAK